jgi:hypothetical protein
VPTSQTASGKLSSRTVRFQRAGPVRHTGVRLARRGTGLAEPRGNGVRRDSGAQGRVRAVLANTRMSVY